MTDLIEPVLNIPNPKLLTLEWPKIIGNLETKGVNAFVKDIKQLCRAYGEINRFYSKGLPDKYFARLQKRMTELRRIVNYANKRKGRIIIPKETVDQWFSGKEVF